MAGIDYYNLETIVQSHITSEMGSGSLVNVTIEVGQPMDSRPWVAIYLSDRIAPDNQPIANGTLQRYTIEFSIWCWGWSLNSAEKAAEMRDDLISDVEIALMKNRSMGGNISNATLHGGKFNILPGEKGHFVGGEIIYRGNVTAST